MNENERNLSEEITEGFKALKAMRNNEPVAYIDLYDLERLPHHDCWVNGQKHKNSVPLYIHPADLTDEQIQEVIDDPQFECVFELEDFARAILKKAQEK
jgi:hypothetical protein